MKKQIETLETLIAKKTDKLLSMVSLGTANRFLGNGKTLAQSATSMRKASNNQAFQDIISEIERLDWEVQCLKVEQFVKGKQS